MIKVTIAQTTVRELNGVSKASGKDYHIRTQAAYAHTVDKDGNTAPYPEKFEVFLDKDAPAYAPGEYQLHPSSVYIDRNGRLAVSARLAPLKTRAPA